MLSDRDRAARSYHLNARGEIRHLSDLSVLGVLVGSGQHSHHHLAGIDPDPRLRRRAANSNRFSRIPPRRLLQAQRRV
jgi:hypothetical protein